MSATNRPRAGKTRVIVLFGGRSAEHEISLLSARNVYLALDRERFDPLPVSIDKQGRWHIEPEQTLLQATGDPRHLRLGPGGSELVVPVRPQNEGEGQALAQILRKDDVVFPVLHGTYGEDGTVQGLLELADVAYVGAGPLGSGIGMDKDVAKRLLAQAGIPVVPWRTLHASVIETDFDRVASEVAGLGYPLFVKPANAGSSVGVSKVKTPADLLPALRQALRFDRKVLAEQRVDAREIECAVLGNDDPRASAPGEVEVTHADGFYSYDAKYVDSAGSRIRIPADIPRALADRVRALSVATFRTLELAGMARVDFFLDRGTADLYVNEVNTIPGFTAISMYPKMWEHAGLDISALCTRLLELAIERRAARRRLETSV